MYMLTLQALKNLLNSLIKNVANLLLHDYMRVAKFTSFSIFKFALFIPGDSKTF